MTKITPISIPEKDARFLEFMRFLQGEFLRRCRIPSSVIEEIMRHPRGHSLGEPMSD